MEKMAVEKFREVLGKFDTAMLTTLDHSGQMHSRPMAIAEIESTGDVIFLTDRHSGKVDEIEAHPKVSVTCQDGWKNTLTISGTAETFRDLAKAKHIWRKTYQTWFPGGPDDPNLVMIRVRGDHGEYWDNSGLQGIKYMFKAVKAIATGTRPDPDAIDEHGAVTLRQDVNDRSR